ncbi:MAG: toll/interleukin-1 receptor domain-containing protein [Moraxellaceae bacterium]|nr:MAG: toll/interleukin-1 receptor domain-containing protein [Moraxellaceae bacterium]
MVSVFISYSHEDEELRSELEKHLKALQRQGLVEFWHDRRIVAGEEWNQEIDTHLLNDEIILLLISADFIASDFCYNIEMQTAIQRHHKQEAVVIPVILRDCDWQSLPFGKLQAATRDGKAVKNYTSLDTAFTEIVGNIKRATQQLNPTTTAPPPAISHELIQNSPLSNSIATNQRSSNLTIKREFTQLQIDRFLIDSYKFIVKFFNNSLAELKERHPDIGLDYIFTEVDNQSFEASIYKNGKRISYAAIFTGKNFHTGLYYSSSQLPQGGSVSYDDFLTINSDGNILTLRASGMSLMSRQSQNDLTQEGAAEYFWAIFITPLQR